MQGTGGTSSCVAATVPPLPPSVTSLPLQLPRRTATATRQPPQHPPVAARSVGVGAVRRSSTVCSAPPPRQSVRATAALLRLSGHCSQRPCGPCHLVGQRQEHHSCCQAMMLPCVIAAKSSGSIPQCRHVAVNGTVSAAATSVAANLGHCNLVRPATVAIPGGREKKRLEARIHRLRYKCAVKAGKI